MRRWMQKQCMGGKIMEDNKRPQMGSQQASRRAPGLKSTRGSSRLEDLSIEPWNLVVWGSLDTWDALALNSWKLARYGASSRREGKGDGGGRRDATNQIMINHAISTSSTHTCQSEFEFDLYFSASPSTNLRPRSINRELRVILTLKYICHVL
jgi:hypothetical protein